MAAEDDHAVIGVLKELQDVLLECCGPRNLQLAALGWLNGEICVTLRKV